GQAPDAGQSAGAEGFDTRLFGCWEVVSYETTKGYFSLWGWEDIAFLYDGSYYGYLFCAYLDYDYNALLGQAVTAGNVLSFPEIYEQLGEVSIVIEYELQDISASSDTDNDYQAFYEKFDDDQLTLRLHASYQDGPTRIVEIESTIVLEKQYPHWDNDILEFTLFGDWTDNYGNKWTFSQEEEETNYPDLTGVMTAANGTAYEISSVYSSLEKDSDCVEYVHISFKDEATGSIDARILSYDGTVLTLEQFDRFNSDSDTWPLVLTRAG
ncbi:MAG: hypothetical protein Q4C13_01230, partial [Clostridia bacterium]|nr:hypothetical protein [Clostridia bacterium]